VLGDPRRQYVGDVIQRHAEGTDAPDTHGGLSTHGAPPAMKGSVAVAEADVDDLAVSARGADGGAQGCVDPDEVDDDVGQWCGGDRVEVAEIEQGGHRGDHVRGHSAVEPEPRAGRVR